MKSKMLVRIILILFVLFILIQPFQISYGVDIVKEARDWFIAARNGEQIFNPDDIASAIAPISQILFAVGLVVLFVVGVVMGIKFITASPEEQGKIIGLAISAVVILGAYTIWKLTYDLMDDIITTSQVVINNDEYGRIA